MSHLHGIVPRGGGWLGLLRNGEGRTDLIHLFVNILGGYEKALAPDFGCAARGWSRGI